MGCHFLLQRIFPTQGLNLGLPHCRQMLYHLSHQGSPQVVFMAPLNSALLSFLDNLPIYSREGNGIPLQYSCLENPMDGRAWWAALHGVARSWTRLSDFTITFHFHALEKEMATHSSVLAQRTPGTAEPGGLLPMGLHRVGHD